MSKTQVFTDTVDKLVLRDRTAAARLLIAFAIAVIAIALRLLLSPALADRIPWVTSFPAVLLAALVGDGLAAAVTLLVCGLVGFALVQPVASSMIAFWLNGALVAWAGVGLRRALRSARAMSSRSARAEVLLAGSEEELRQQVSDLTRLHEFAMELISIQQPEAVLQRLLETTMALQGADRGFIELFDEASNRLTPGVSVARDAGGAGARSVWSTPLLTRKGELLGVLSTLYPPARPQTERQSQLVKLYLRLASDAIEMRLLSQRREEDRFRLLVSAVRDYEIIMLDPDGRVETWNPGAEAIKGYGAEEILGKHIEVFYTPEDRAAGVPRALLERARREGRAEHQGWHVRKEGTQFWADVTVAAMRNNQGELTGFAKVVRDLTERRTLEHERLRAARAEEAVRVRDEFLSVAAHELKTPLAALQLQLETLQLQLVSKDEQMGKRFGRAARSSARLSDLVRSLLDVSRIAAGRLELSRERFALGDAMVDVVERLRDAATAAGCDVRVTCDEAAEGAWDRLRIEQVVTNLVANAIKYAPGAPIEVTVKTDGDDALLEVRDGGSGIDEADLPRLFQRFERGESARHHGGLGLGLYVTREIVEAHGGSVVARNVEGGGARFSVRLPRSRVVSRGVQPEAGGLH